MIQNFFQLPLIREADCAVQLDIAGCDGFRDHKNFSAMLENTRVGSMVPQIETSAYLTELSVMSDRRHADDAAFFPISKIFEEKPSGPVVLKQKRVCPKVSTRGLKPAESPELQLAEAQAESSVNSTLSWPNADPPVIDRRPPKRAFQFLGS
jgi:hypothetical protein